MLAWSGWQPRDGFTWWLEVAPALAGLAILVAIYSRFRFTELVCWLMLIHAVILMIGGHYTYAEVPLFNWLRDTFGLARNHFDRVGHFAQGFVPAILAREVMLRHSPLQPGKWLFFLVVCFCLALSAFYELIEWLTALVIGDAAESFLGTQGDPWDTQTDMALALIGAVTAQKLLGHLHDQHLAKL
jgi:putative membrane protein